MKVRAAPVEVITRKGQYDTLALSFESEEDPDLSWTMEIERNNDYIENELESIVRKIYAEKKGG